MRRRKSLLARKPASEPCNCPVCLGSCKRPGWWTLEQAAAALKSGHGNRMMLEMSSGNTFGALAPAFQGCGGAFATQMFAGRRCAFLKDDLWQLHGGGFEPLECLFCHHDRPGPGRRCHADSAGEWNTAAGRALVIRWSNLTNFWTGNAAVEPGKA